MKVSWRVFWCSAGLSCCAGAQLLQSGWCTGRETAETHWSGTPGAGAGAWSGCECRMVEAEHSLLSTMFYSLVTLALPAEPDLSSDCLAIVVDVAVVTVVAVAVVTAVAASLAVVPDSSSVSEPGCCEDCVEPVVERWRSSEHLQHVSPLLKRQCTLAQVEDL